MSITNGNHTTTESTRGPTANYPTEPEEIRKRIEHVLSIYPGINFTMLQVGLGTGFKPRVWRPILSEMLKSGAVIQDEVIQQGPTGRHNVYVHLAIPVSLELKQLRKADGCGPQED